MGNNLACNNYYCNDIVLKPEWFSENSWNIYYNYFNIDKNYKNNYNFKPYTIEKGTIKINQSPQFNLAMTKKLNINLDDVEKFTIPINLKHNLNTDLSFYCILTSYDINSIDNIYSILNNNMTNYLYFELKFSNKNLIIKRSYDNKISKIKTKNETNYYYNIEIISNNSLNISEKLFKENNQVFEHSSSKVFKENTIYLTMFIISHNEMINKNSFIELNFD